MKLADDHLPRGWLRWLLRLPVWLYRARLGWLLGKRFLLLTHTGRKTGLPRRTVLEVVQYDAATRTFIVASGWGEKSSWFQNIQAHPEVEVASGGLRFEACGEQLPVEQAEQVLTEYARRHPVAFRWLAPLMAGERQNSVAENIRAMAQTIPLVALRPRPVASNL